MTYLAGLVVQAKTLPPLVAAAKKAFASIGAVEGEGVKVVIGAPIKGWSLITDGTRQTFDLGVAAALAHDLKTRVLAFGLRGSGSHGKAASKAFGTWSKKPPSSGKPKAIRDAIDKLGKDLIPMPWEVDSRKGVTLSFDLRNAKCTPGPFKTTTASERRAAEERAQQDTTWHISSRLLNGRFDEAMECLPGLLDPWGWRDATNHVMHLLHTHSLKLEPRSARGYVALATRALEGLTTTTLQEHWVGKETPTGPWPMIRQALPLLCALVAEDTVAWKQFVGGLDSEREPFGLYIRSEALKARAALSKASHALLDKEFPVERILAWALTATHDRDTNYLVDAAMLAAIEGNNEVLDRVFAITGDKYLADALHRRAMYLVRTKQFTAALAMFDRLLALSPTTLEIYTNALYAVQSDNNGMAVDRERAQRYVAAATPHAENNTAIYINLACVHLELGDRPAMQAALDAMKRHKMRTELTNLLAQPMFKKAKVK